MTFLTPVTPSWPLTPNWSCQKCAFTDLILWPSMSIIGPRVSEILTCWQIEERRRRKKLMQYKTLPRCAGRVKSKILPLCSGVVFLVFYIFLASSLPFPCYMHHLQGQHATYKPILAIQTCTFVWAWNSPWVVHELACVPPWTDLGKQTIMKSSSLGKYQPFAKTNHCGINPNMIDFSKNFLLTKLIIYSFSSWFDGVFRSIHL